MHLQSVFAREPAAEIELDGQEIIEFVPTGQNEFAGQIVHTSPLLVYPLLHVHCEIEVDPMAELEKLGHFTGSPNTPGQ